jgi:hypothetical protein
LEYEFINKLCQVQSSYLITCSTQQPVYTYNMPNNKVSPISLYSFAIPILLIAGLLFGGVTVVSYQAAKAGNVGEVLAKKTEKPDKPEKPSKPTKAEKERRKVEVDPVATAQVHKNNVKNVRTALQEVVETETELGNEEVATELEITLASVDEEETDNVSQAMIQVESRPKWRTALIGSDYKNLGQLRSHMVKNRNTIRQLTRTMEKVDNPETQEALELQIATLQLEQTRIWTVIAENESSFSLLGWVFRFLNNYINVEPVEDLVNGIGGVADDPIDTDENDGIDENINGDNGEEENRTTEPVDLVE